MCSYITEKASIFGSAKGPEGWMKVDTANVYFDHPYHAPLDHSLNIDFVDESAGVPSRVAIEISAESARELVKRILAALEAGGEAHSDLVGEAHPDLVGKAHPNLVSQETAAAG